MHQFEKNYVCYGFSPHIMFNISLLFILIDVKTKLCLYFRRSSFCRMLENCFHGLSVKKISYNECDNRCT